MRRSTAIAPFSLRSARDWRHQQHRAVMATRRAGDEPAVHHFGLRTDEYKQCGEQPMPGDHGVAKAR